MQEDHNVNVSIGDDINMKGSDVSFAKDESKAEIPRGKQ